MHWEPTSLYACAECLSGVAMRQWRSTTFNCEVGLCRKCFKKLRKDMDRDSIKFPAFEIASDSQQIYDMDGRCTEFARHIDTLHGRTLHGRSLQGRSHSRTSGERLLWIESTFNARLYRKRQGSRVKSLAPNHIVRGLET